VSSKIGYTHQQRQVMLDADLDRGRLRLFDHEGEPYHGLIIRSLIRKGLCDRQSRDRVDLTSRGREEAQRLQAERAARASRGTHENPRKTVPQRTTASRSVPQ
jgi:hypothetical protein